MKRHSAPPASVELPSDRLREEARKQLIAACKAASEGAGPPPELDSFLAGFVEPERSELRCELENIERSCRQDNGGVTIVPPTSSTIAERVPAAAALPTGTVDYVRPPTKELAGIAAALGGPGATTDHVAAAGAGTVDRAPDVPLQTVDRVSSGVDEAAEAPDKEQVRQPLVIKDYEVLGVLGRGAMGVVYKARQRGLDRLVALKMILSGGHASATELGRFRSEAQAVARLQHPNIVQIYEVGEEAGLPFFSLEYVEGTSLDKKARGEPLLAPRETARLAQQLAQAMDYAHKRGIIHRDLKPANVLLTVDGTPKIGDFGLAKRLEEESGQTRTGTVLGTPSYMAPEQAEGKLDEVGPLSDVYSLGAVIYDLLTGRAPFRGTTMLETLEQVRTREPVHPMQLQPGVPRDLETICLKCLQKYPARRYASAGALAEDLGRFLSGIPILARPISSVERLWRLGKRNPRTALLAVGAVVLVVGWAVSSSVFAGLIKVEKDNADQQAELAGQNAKEATKQARKAKDNEDRANHESELAKRNERSAKDTADSTVKQMVRLGELVQNRLQSKRLTIQAGPEARRLRDDLLNTLRQSLGIVSASINKAGATAFGEAGTYQALGDLLKKLGQGPQALKAYEKGYELVKQIADARPQSDLARGNLGLMLQRLGDVPLEINGDARTALKYYQQARDLHWDILAKPRDGFYPEVEIKQILSHDDIHIGEARLALGLSAPARKSFAEALSYRRAWEAAQKKEPEKTVARSFVMQAHVDMGIASARLADAAAAREHFGQALRVGEGLVRQHPKYAGFKADLADAQGAYGDALLRLGKTEDADTLYRQALKNLEFVLASDPDDLSWQPVLAEMHERLAIVCRRLGKSADADKHVQEALRLRAELLQMDPENVSRQAAHALALARCGKCSEANRAATQTRPRVKQSTDLLLQLARAWAVCAEKDQKQKAQFVDRALDALRAATSDGYRDSFVLRTDPNLEALGKVAGFQMVVAQVKKREP